MKVSNQVAPGAASDMPTTTTGSRNLSQQDFMKLFLTQMRTQSPLKPFDSSDMMQQMTQLNSLSATEQLEKSIRLMNSNLGRSQVVAATQLIGKKVVIPSQVSQLTESDGLNGSVVVPAHARSIEVEIKDKDDKLVKKLSLPASDSGVVDFHWDGKDENGEMMPADYYHLSAKGDFGGEQIDIPTAGYFKVNSVTMDRQTSSVILNLDGLGGVDMGNIIKILS